MKRGFDLIASVLGLIFLIPIFILIFLYLRTENKSNPFFIQERVGLKGKIFLLYKFRTMAEDHINTSPLTIGDDQRITKTGKFLRKYKLDELPQLFNVILGEMSLVGPRPELLEFIKLYPKEIREKVLSIRPGVTDPASMVLIEENKILADYLDPYKAYVETIIPLKQKLYLEYISNQTLTGDIKIIFLTVLKIFARKVI